ncbi:kinesin-like protein KIN-7L isoform X2 [Drosophila guanche]|uniref:kinesin-like protein KIN-7L isoform X2 n=2 Tax=Drosophila guanche TaxID=7266 RepID=UPI00147162D8|nr:kinesin-like protein KIN-7L isoform X2 [Drosophila guanche]
MAKPIVHKVISGNNGTLITYGGTSSGKTHTMLGDDQNPGVIELATKEIFETIRKDKQRSFLLRLQFIEINNKIITDLIKKRHTEIKIKDTGNGNVKVSSEEYLVSSKEELLQWLFKGKKKRSKRSHAILRIIIESRSISAQRDEPVMQSVLNLVDLAGCSNIMHMSNNNVSFRDQQLNQLLGASLGGNACTGIICTANPNNFLETRKTLQFASRVRKVCNRPLVNVVAYKATMMKQQDLKTKKLREQLAKEERVMLGSPRVDEQQDGCTECTGLCKAFIEKLVDRPQLEMLLKEDVHATLHELCRDVLRSTRDVCPELQSSCERMFHNCVELERLQAEGESVCDGAIELTQRELQAEIAEMRTKLEDAQLSYDMAKCQVSEITEDCNRLNLQLSTAQADNAQLQAKNDQLQQICQTQQQAIQAMQADYYDLQQKFEKVQQDYEDLGRTSKANKDQCLQLEADNTALQAEIVTLKERVEQAQRVLLESSNQKALAEQLKEKNDELKAELSDVQSSFQEMQRKYDCLSNDLMESVEECDGLRKECNALREELKQRSTPSYDIESMKSSGVGTECSEADLESETDSGFLEKFVKLSDSLHEIELQQSSGCSRLFRATEIQEHNVPGLKLWLEPATNINTVAHTLDDDAEDAVCLKGVLRQHRFQIIRLTQETAPAQDAEKGLVQLLLVERTAMQRDLKLLTEANAALKKELGNGEVLTMSIEVNEKLLESMNEREEQFKIQLNVKEEEISLLESKLKTKSAEVKEMKERCIIMRQDMDEAPKSAAQLKAKEAASAVVQDSLKNKNLALDKEKPKASLNCKEVLPVVRRTVVKRGPEKEPTSSTLTVPEKWDKSAESSRIKRRRLHDMRRRID